MGEQRHEGPGHDHLDHRGGGAVHPDPEVDQPPDDPDAWSEEQWLAWLQAHEAPEQAPPPGGWRRVTTAPLASAIGAAMVAVDQALFGEREDTELVVEADDDGDDAGMRFHLDPLDPTASAIEVAPHRATDPGR